MDQHHVDDVYRLWSTHQSATDAGADGTTVQFDGVIPADLADMAVTQTARGLGCTTHELVSTRTGDMSIGTVEVRHRGSRTRLGSCHYAHAGHVPTDDQARAVVATVDGLPSPIVVGTANHDIAERAVRRDLPEHAHRDVTFGGYGVFAGIDQRDGAPAWISTSTAVPQAQPYWTVRTPVAPLAFQNADEEWLVLGTADAAVATRVVVAELDEDASQVELEWAGWHVFVEPELDMQFELQPMQAGDDPTWSTPLWLVHR